MALLAAVAVALSLVALTMCWVKRVTLFWLQEAALDWATGLSEKDAVNPYIVSGNYQSVEPLIPGTPAYAHTLKFGFTEFGQLPQALKNGAFVQLSPNNHRGASHWYDGDGMVHALLLKDGKPVFASACVQTARFKAGSSLFPKFRDRCGLLRSSLASLKQATGVFSAQYGVGAANEGLVFHGNRLLVLSSDDMPYAVRVGHDAEVQTLERVRFRGSMYGARPFLEPVTGELHGVSTAQSNLCYSVLAKSGGAITRSLTMDMPFASEAVEVAITESDVLFIVNPLLSTAQGPAVDGSKRLQVGVLPRGVSKELQLRWLQLKSMFVQSIANAWRDGDIIYIACVASESMSVAGMGSLEEPAPHFYATMIKLDLASGAATSRRLSDMPGRFPIVNPLYKGREAQYMYMITEAKLLAGAAVRFDGLARLDLQAEGGTGMCRVALGTVHAETYHDVRNHLVTPMKAQRRFGGPFCFINKEGASGEDDGFLAGFVYDEPTAESEFVVYKAGCLELNTQPLARITLPQRVPYGRAAAFIDEASFKLQFPFDFHYIDPEQD